MPIFSSKGEKNCKIGTENDFSPQLQIQMNHWIIFEQLNLCFFLPTFFLSCDWHLNPQSTFNVCLQSIMDVYFVYCWFAKSMFCVTNNVVYSSVRLCSLTTGMFNKNICLCSNQCLFMSGSSLSACLFSFLFFSLPLCKTSIRWTCLRWFVF